MAIIYAARLNNIGYTCNSDPLNKSIAEGREIKFEHQGLQVKVRVNGPHEDIESMINADLETADIQIMSLGKIFRRRKVNACIHYEKHEDHIRVFDLYNFRSEEYNCNIKGFFRKMHQLKTFDFDGHVQVPKVAVACANLVDEENGRYFVSGHPLNQALQKAYSIYWNPLPLLKALHRFKIIRKR